MSSFSGLDRFAISVKQDQVIFCEYEPGDRFYLIQSGRIKIVKVFGDIEKILDVLQPGEFFGEMAILENAPRSATAIAVDDCVLLEFNKNNFESLMTGNPQIASKLLKTFIKRIHDQKRRFMILTLPDIEDRVTDVLVMLSENQFPEEMELGERVLETSMDDIAHWAGLSEKECKDILNRLINVRKIEVTKDRVIVKNINEMIRRLKSKRK
jgi:CRP-like cAMP-binding protein